jgi:DNA polymerase-3 subunit alpha
MTKTLDFVNSFQKIDLPLYGVRLPEFKVKVDHKRKLGLSEDASNTDFLKKLAYNNLPKKPEYKKRLDHEFEIIEDLGFIDYIILVWLVINYCKENEIPTGLGRGSAAGSLILFLIGVTKIDPIKHNLYFERFISKIRAKKQVVDGITYLDGSLMCDVDLDICYYNRHKVIEFLNEVFPNRISKILTFNTLSGKLLIKECGKIVEEKSETEMTSVSSLIPKVFGQVKDISEAYNEVEKFKEWCDENQEIYNIALKLRNLIKNKGVHPSGVQISHAPLSEACPLELSSDKEPVSAFDMNDISQFNVKLDLLGLRSVSVVYDVCRMINLKIEDIDTEDVFIYQQLQDLRSPHGLFQIEADTNFKVCRKVRPRNSEELSAVLALARPGALQFVDQYAKYVETGEYQSVHPFFDETLKRTGGLALYQEQLMQMAHKIGFTLDQAEILRRIVGKKKVEEIKEWKEKIEKKCASNNLPKEIGEILWKILEDSANYSFNASHSQSYAGLAAITIYLKFKYPREFFLSLLRMTRYEPDPISEISKIHKEMDLFNIKLLPPHIINSEMDFSVEGNDIRFGLLSIKGISDKSIERLNNFRSKYATKFDVFKSAQQAKLSIRVLSPLIQAGALENFKQSRSKVVLEAQLWNILTQNEQKYCMMYGEKFDYDLFKIIKFLNNTKDEKGKQIIKDTRLETIRKSYDPYKKIYEQNSRNERFANWYYENKLLGYTYNTTLKDIFSDQKPDLLNIREVNEAPEGLPVLFIGIIKEQYLGVANNSKKTRYLRLSIQDESSKLTTLIFNDKIDECKEMNNILPDEGNIVIVKGRKKGEDTVFADLIAIQDHKIYMKLGEVKEK